MLLYVCGRCKFGMVTRVNFPTLGYWNQANVKVPQKAPVAYVGRATSCNFLLGMVRKAIAGS